MFFMESKDRYTRVTGAASLLKALGYRAERLTPDRLRQLPERSTLVIGAFATADARVRLALWRQRRHLAALLKGGGRVIMLTQSSGDEGRLRWLPAGLVAVRGNLDFRRPQRLVGAGGWLRGLSPQDWGAWEIKPPGWSQASGYMTVTEAFKELRGFQVLLAKAGDGAFPALAVASVGRGWLVLCALAPDKVFAHGSSDLMKQQASRLMSRLLRTTPRGRFRPSAAFVSRPQPRRGLVYLDGNRNGRLDPGESGLAGVRLNFGTESVVTDRAGRFVITVDPDRIGVVSVHLPADKRATTPFYIRTSDPAPLEFGLAPRRGGVPSRYSIVQLTDSHIAGWRPEKDKRRLLALAEQITRMQPRPAFVIHTGDVTTSCRQSEFQIYRHFPRALRMPVFHLMGNHDISKGPDRFESYRHHLGPENYSFDFGPHRFVAGYQRYRPHPLQRWIAQQIARSDRPVVLLVHHFPTRKFLEQVKHPRLFAIISGDWHSSKVSRVDGRVWVINSPTPLMGGLDNSPKALRLITLGGDTVRTELRYTGVERLLKIVAPQPGGDSQSGLWVNALDATVGVASLRYELRRPDGRLITAGALRQRNRWSFHASLPPLRGALTISVEATGADGSRWQIRRALVLGDVAPKVRLGKPSTMFRRGPQRNGISPTAILPSLRLRWVAAMPGEITLQTPLLSKDGTLYVATDDRHSATRRDASLSAIDATSGKLLWRQATGEPVLHAPLLHRGRLISVGIDGTVLARHPKSGRVLWRTGISAHSPSIYQSYWVGVSPLALGSQLWITHPPAPLLLDVATGRVLHALPKLGREAFTTFTSPSSGLGLIFSGSLHNGLRALTLSSHPRTRWESRRFRLSATPVFDQGKVYALGHRHLRVFQATSGRELLSVRIPGSYNLATPVVENGRVYLATGKGVLLALDATTGKQLWATPTGKALLDLIPYRFDEPGIVSSPTISGNVIYVGANDGLLYAVDKRNGKVLWRADLGSPVTASPVLSGNTLFIGAYDGKVYAFTSAQ